MAKVRAPLISFGGLGQVGKTVVFDKWKGQKYVRKYSKPSNPQSAAQTLSRQSFTFANGVWANAPGVVTVPWGWTASLGVLTGRNAFMGRFVKDVRGDTDLDNFEMQPGARGGFALASMNVTPGSEEFLVELFPPPLPAGWTISAGVAAVIRDQDPATGTLYDITGAIDLSDPYQITTGNLVASVVYQVHGWLWMKKPDGSPAYGPSLHVQATPLV